jgi:alkanesulfonate monooxygenase SsuD/methylene tetrahydromethanopterin reductase-like flavin-dependent oxidoreductase (luciferase family)
MGSGEGAPMNYGIYVPNFGEETSAQSLADLAREAEEAGWNGFFIWDQILHSRSNRYPLVDPWVTLTAIAMKTTRIRIGTTVTAVARRRPWKLARETVTLDHLSNGRLTLGVGLGYPPDADFGQFGEDPDSKVRAAKLDEGLEILLGLWSGNPFAYHGKYYTLEKTVFLPKPIQRPRIPIWVGGYWPNKAPFRRAARYDGALPLKSGGTMQPKDLREIQTFVNDNRADRTPFDLVMMGYTPGDEPEEARKKVEKYTKAGSTWWLESLFRMKNSVGEMRKRIHQGPPRLKRAG